MSSERRLIRVFRPAGIVRRAWWFVRNVRSV